VTECDWIVKASLLVLNAATVTPQKNDQIEEADGTIWQVLPLGSSEQEFRPVDPYSTAYRVHTKRVTV
jgi:hypothetical protein